MDSNWARHRELIAGSISHSDRVLILGSGGWFGQTFKVLTSGLASVMPHAIRTADQTDADFYAQVEDFDPTIVANFAFLTPHFTRTMTQDAYMATNRRVFQRFQYAASLPRVRVSLHASSGAVVTPSEALGAVHQTYRELKLAEEEAILSGGLAERCGVVRAFSVSGPFVRMPDKYAFSDMIAQALRGRIRVRASRPTYRRYCSLADLLTVALVRTSRLGGGVLESGGPLIEMRDLASLIADLTSPEPTVGWAAWEDEVPVVYASDDSSWTAACREVGLKPTGLQQQVHEVQGYLLSESASQ